MNRRSKYIAIWGVIASMLFLTSALPSAYGLEFPMTTSIEIEPPLVEAALAFEEVTPLRDRKSVV